MRRQKRRETFKNLVIDYINDNAKAYIIITLMFLIGIVLGIIFVNNTNENQQNQIGGYINNFIDATKNNQQISSQELLKEYIKSDSYTALILWFLGSTVIGAPLIYLAILYKGYSIGYTISSVIATIGAGKGVIFILTTMLFKYIIYVPCILSIAVSGIKLYKMIIQDRRNENIKIQLIRHTLFCILMLILMTISSIIGTYLSMWLLKMLVKWY